MVQLGRADALEHLDAVGVEPTAVHIRGQRLAGREAEPQRREVALARSGMCEHCGIIVGTCTRIVGTVTLDQLEEPLGGRALRKDDPGPPTPNVKSVVASRA